VKDQMRSILAACLAAGLLVIPARGSQDPRLAELRGSFTTALERVASGLDGVMAYAIVDLSTGDRIERLPGAVLATASSIKLSILYELFKQAEEGRLALDDLRPLDRRHAVGGAGVLAQLTAPSLSLRDYATLMIVLSDNTATNVVIDAVGMDAVTQRMAGLGLKETKLRRRMIDTEAARRGDENVSTAADIALLLERLHAGQGLSGASQEQVLEILKKPKTTPIHRGIPAGIAVASKSGSLDGIQADAGIVYVPGRPYVIAVMTGYLARASDGEKAIADVSAAAFGYFDRLARNSEYGRIIR
jgi:beta-lactamase class A